VYLGAHMSIAGGVEKAIELGSSINCSAIQLFTKNNNQWKAKPLTDQSVSVFHHTWVQSGIEKIVAHTGYLINLANPGENWVKSMDSMELEIVRAERLGIPYLVMHPGSHLGEGEEYGLKRIADSLNTLMGKYPDYKLVILLETTAGQGTNMGYTFEHLARIMDMLGQPERYGICLDTCHIFSAGYDLRTEKGYNETFDTFDRVLGIDKIKAIHLNDSKTGFASRKDRHEHIGKGTLGLEPFRFLLNDPRLKHIPMVLETPKDKNLTEDKENLKILYSLID